MVQPSTFTTVAFVAVVAAVAVMIVWGFAIAGRRESAAHSRAWAVRAGLGVAAWLTFTGVVSGSGVLESPGLPPRAMFFLVGCNVVALGLALSRPGTLLIKGLPIAALVGFAAYRLPLELVLHQWYVEGVLPVQMTYVSRNLDILSGVLGLMGGLWLWRRGTSRPLVWAVNLVGMGLLLNVGAIAVLSSPFPFRVFTNDPAVLLIFHFPYGWILPMCVAPALAGHVLVFRWLWQTRGGAGS